ncbi:MAG: T9SS type A sorting domain-containing protein [Calditrichaeota bacterium]|nr:T9SS type A sorting domain-containing protein [Calditrichota bacterium]
MKKSMDHMVVLLLLFAIVAMSTGTNAQPVNRWIRNYDGNNDHDYFYDVFATAEGGYAMAGYSGINDQQESFWLVVTDAEGGEIWQRIYADERFPRSARSYSLIQTDDGGFVLGGQVLDRTPVRHFSLLRVDAEGERLWWRTYGMAAASVCLAVIELKSGEFVGCGRAPLREAYAVMVDGDGNVLWDNTYAGRTFYAMRETQGGLLFAGTDNDANRWLLKTDFDGERLWSRTYGPGILYSLVSCPEGGFAAAGIMLFENDYAWFLLRINDEGETLWTRVFNLGEREQLWCLTRAIDGGFAMVGQSSTRSSEPIIIRTDSAGNEQWRRIDNNHDGGIRWDRYQSAIVGRDNLLMVAGSTYRGVERNIDGVLVKIVPDRSPPTIWAYIPEDLEFSVLQNDSISFAIIEAEDVQNDSLLYFWTFDGDTVGTDTSKTITFQELGDHFVECFVSDGDQADSVQWAVHVEEFYIRSFEPDSLELILQRGTEINFGIDVAALEEVDVENIWTLIHRNDQHEDIGDENVVSVLFDQSGRHQLQALLSHEDVSDEVTWTINVRSAIWSWWPSEHELTAYVDSTLEFVITPFNEESDSLDYLWLLDDEQLESDSASIMITFPETGQNELTSIVRDGIEADTLSWTIDVAEWSFTADDADLADLPTSPVLYPASPNPFNSSVKLSMYLPQAEHVSLSVFDIHGREVSRLVDGDVTAGNQFFIWDANGFPAGVYVVRMSAGEVSEMRKVVLVR